MAQNEKEQNDYRITYYNTVSSKEVDWLWYPYIPYGKITILQGDPGESWDGILRKQAMKNFVQSWRSMTCSWLEKKLEFSN